MNQSALAQSALTPEEVSALRKIEGGADITCYELASTLRRVEWKRPELLIITTAARRRRKVTQAEPYFGAILTEAGKQFLEGETQASPAATELPSNDPIVAQLALVTGAIRELMERGLAIGAVHLGHTRPIVILRGGDELAALPGVQVYRQPHPDGMVVGWVWVLHDCRVQYCTLERRVH